MGAWPGDRRSSSAEPATGAAWGWVRITPTAGGRGGLRGSGWRMLGKSSCGSWGWRGAGSSAGSMGASGAGATKASWNFRFGVDCWANDCVAAAASASGGSGGERMDWMRSWEAIVTAGWVSRGDPLTQTQSRQGLPWPHCTVQQAAAKPLGGSDAGTGRRAETRRSVGVVGRTASAKGLNTHAHEGAAGRGSLAAAEERSREQGQGQHNRQHGGRTAVDGRGAARLTERSRKVGGTGGAQEGDRRLHDVKCASVCVTASSNGAGSRSRAGGRTSERAATAKLCVAGRANVTPKRCWRCCSGVRDGSGGCGIGRVCRLL